MQWATVSTKGQLVIPAEIRAALGIEPGTRVSISQEGSRIVLQPVTRQRTRETRGMFANPKGESMSEMLLRERRKEARYEKW